MAPLRELASDFFDAVFGVDSKLLRSVRELARPGQATVSFMNGKRAPYLSPLRIYLFTSVSYFVLAQLVGETDLMFVTSTGESDLPKVLPRIMFFIVPAAAAALAMLFRRPPRLYAEHLVATLHIHAAWYVIFAVSLLVARVVPPPEALADAPWWVWPVATLGIALRLAVPAYTYVALRRVYDRSHLATGLRTVGFFVAYFVLLGVAVFGWMELIR